MGRDRATRGVKDDLVGVTGLLGNPFWRSDCAIVEFVPGRLNALE